MGENIKPEFCKSSACASLTLHTHVEAVIEGKKCLVSL